MCKRLNPQCMSALCCIGLSGGLSAISLLIVSATNLPTSLTAEEIRNPATGREYSPDKQSQLLHQKLIASQPYKQCLIGLGILGISILLIILFLLYVYLTGYQVRVAPEPPMQGRQGAVLVSTTPPRSHFGATTDEPPLTVETISLHPQTQQALSLPQGQNS